MENNGVFNGTNYNDISGTNGNERVINTNVNGNYNGNFQELQNSNGITVNNLNDNSNDIIDNNDSNRSKLPVILFILVFVTGLGIMFYPTVCNLINHSRHKYVINQYDTEVDQASLDLKKEMLSSAQEYNKIIDGSSIRDVFSTDKVSKDSSYDNLLSITDDGLMGYLSIPKINVKLPIYHGTNDDVLEKGVGHLKGSSLPVGGVGTHSILAAHRGLPSSKLFSDLDKIVVGDKFYISILDEILVYKVDNVAVVLPSELGLLDLDKSKDYVTLVTCTPYGVNTHRILVRGTRIEENISDVKEELDRDELIYLSQDDKVLFGTIFGILLVIIILVFISLRKKHE